MSHTTDLRRDGTGTRTESVGLGEWRDHPEHQYREDLGYAVWGLGVAVHTTLPTHALYIVGSQAHRTPPSPMWPMLVATGPEPLVNDSFSAIVRLLDTGRGTDQGKLIRASLPLAVKLEWPHDELWLTKYKLLVLALLDADGSRIYQLESSLRHRELNSQPLGPLLILGGEDDGPCPVGR